MNMDVQGSVALVTGANRGLGKAYVEELLAANCSKIYAGMRTPQPSGDDRVIPVRLDVTSPEAIGDAARMCSDVNIVINNAGVMFSAPILSAYAEEAIRAEMDVNVYGPMRMARAFAPILAANGGGALANMLSVVSWFIPPSVATYAASKHAALAVTESLRIELKAQGTQVVAIHAGFIDTDMAAHITPPKVSPYIVARATLDAIRNGDDIALADERSQQIAAMTHLDRSAQQQQQATWDLLNANKA
jgi:NAD(P)-dependent dehydrogenase (short-subunit alcohol dehydrogenase family)